MYSDDIKVILIQWIIQENPSLIAVASEVPFLHGSKRADVVSLSSNGVAAYEIKGPRDDLRRLPSQLETYRKMFNSVVVVADHAAIAKIRATASRQVGLLSVSDEHIAQIRRPNSMKLISKQHAARWLRVDELLILCSRYAIRTNRHMDIENARRLVQKKLSAVQMNKEVLGFLAIRWRERFAAFKRERGQKLDHEDLQILKMNGTITKR